MTHIPDEIKEALDWTSVGAGIGAFFQLLPDMASLLTVIWLGLRVWESETVREWTKRK